MKIIKNGLPLDEIVYRFICPECECEFEAGREEMQDGQCGCPNCGEPVSGEKVGS